jgi:adenosylcobinamide-phosphate synthase
MTAILAAILLEHFRPLQSSWTRWLTRPLNTLAHLFNAGTHQYGVIAWLIAVLPLLIITSLIFFTLTAISAWLGWLWQIAILYGCIRFKSVTKPASTIANALNHNELTQAQTLYSFNHHEIPVTTNGLARVTIESLFSDALHYIFGVLFWFILLAPLGPVGALLYRLSHHLALTWQPNQIGAFAQFSQRASQVLDALPARLTALTFAIAGDFEDAVYCWRSQAADWANHNLGIVLASAAGAMEIKLGGKIQHQQGETWRPELGLGNPPETPDINSAISLIWRALTIWLLLLFFFAIAKLAH